MGMQGAEEGLALGEVGEAEAQMVVVEEELMVVAAKAQEGKEKVEVEVEVKARARWAKAKVVAAVESAVEVMVLEGRVMVEVAAVEMVLCLIVQNPRLDLLLRALISVIVGLSGGLMYRMPASTWR